MKALTEVTKKLSAERGNRSVVVIELRREGDMVHVDSAGTLVDEDAAHRIELLRAIILALNEGADSYKRLLEDERQRRRSLS